MLNKVKGNLVNRARLASEMVMDGERHPCAGLFANICKAHGPLIPSRYFDGAPSTQLNDKYFKKSELQEYAKISAPF